MARFGKGGALMLVVWLAGCGLSKPPAGPIPGAAEIESVAILANQARQAAAHDKLIAWADAGSPVAQRAIAQGLLMTPGHDSVATAWLVRAAEGGDGEAGFLLGEAYRSGGLGLKADLPTAWRWYRLAAEHEHAKAALALARMARNGDGVPRDVHLAAQWLQFASDRGNGEAMFLLSNAYMAGEGVPRNPLMGRHLLEMAADRANPAAIQALSMAVENGDLMTTKNPQLAEQLRIEEGHELKHRWGDY